MPYDSDTVLLPGLQVSLSSMKDCPLCSSPVNRVSMNKKPSSLAATRKAFSGRHSICVTTLSCLVHICVEQAIFHADILHLVKCQQIQRDVALTHRLPFRTSI